MPSTTSRIIMAVGGASASECQPLQAANGNGHGPQQQQQEVKLRKELGLFDGVAIIVGVIIGAGIFVSPKGVLEHAGSVGLALIVWVLSGLLSLVGALCYAELGTMIPKSGGDYAYIGEAFGPLPAFLYLWVALFVIIPTGNAITALTFAQYLIQMVLPNCEPNVSLIRLIAALVTCLLTAINCRNVKLVTKVQDVFVGAKILALGIIIVAGLVFLCQGNLQNLSQPMEGSSLEPASIALSFYSGLFSYAGWNYLNFVTEELQNPYKTLPRAIAISLPLCTIVYVLTNVAYFAVLTRNEILSSEAVAVTFGDRMLGSLTWVMPFFVACSTFGALNGAIFASARLFFVGARQGHLPAAIALINIDCLTPIPSLLFLCLITLVLLFIDDVYVLINYLTFVESLFITMSILGLLWLRYKQPDAHRPIKVNIMLPIMFFIVCIFLVTMPVYKKPGEVGVGLLIIATGIPVYLICIRWKNKPKWMINASDRLNLLCVKVFKCVLEEKED
ncbi:large neutral amino acids transporter small subunit 1 [Neocloeon triangulifer]|uniref:large neutral amino acids transporter small subunit 1 n=1 Tax=Neocloeon triangulifer TaxID=2078957 RepID=UPI00286F289C|nr:large neutral amino acids transporter small subunit 1 [Neocloeon triangulifer]